MEIYIQRITNLLVANKNAPCLQGKVKVKVTPVHALRFCTGRTAYRESRGITLPFHDHGTRRGEGSASRPGRSLPPGKTRYPLYRSLGGHHGRSGRVQKISPPTGIWSPDRPGCSQSLYRLSYPGPQLYFCQLIKVRLSEFAREIRPTFYPRFLSYLDRKNPNDDFDDADLIYFDLFHLVLNSNLMG